MSKIYKRLNVLVYVVDIQKDGKSSIKYLKKLILQIQKYNKNVHYEIFLHKIDGIPENYQLSFSKIIIYL